jgi:hypothetical protein
MLLEAPKNVVPISIGMISMLQPPYAAPPIEAVTIDRDTGT